MHVHTVSLDYSGLSTSQHCQNQGDSRQPIRRLVLFVAVVAALALPAVAWAQPYSAAASAERLGADAMRSTMKIERSSTKETAPGDVGEILSQSGVVVSRTGSASAAPILRGLTGSQVLLMADELRLNDPLTRAGGNALLNLIDLESIQRVEVIRGPASVLYGSDAMGGVVRVITRRPDPPQDISGVGANVYARFASATRAQRIQGSVGALHGPFGAYISGSYQHAGLLQRGGDLGPQAFSGYDLATISSQLTLYRSQRHNFSLSHQSGHIWDAPRTDVSTQEDRQTTLHLDRDAALLRYEALFPDQRMRLSAYAAISLRTEERERVRPGRLQIERDRVLGYQLGSTLNIGLWRDAALDVGVQATLDRIGSGTEGRNLESGAMSRERGRYIDGSRYDSAALFALYTQPLGSRFLVQAGARVTWVGATAGIDPLFDARAQQQLDRSFFGESLTMGTRYEITPQLAWLLNVLSGFRSPNLEDFQTFGGGARGFSIPNPTLNAERSWTAETGLKWGSRQLQASMFSYATLLTDLIVRVPSTFQGMSEIDGEPVLRRENASHGYLLGAEAEVLAQLGAGWFGAMRASGAWGETIRPNEAGVSLREPASKVPGPLAALRVGYSSGGLGMFFAHADLQAQLPQSRLSESDRLDVRLCQNGPNNCDKVPGYVDLSVRAGLRLLTRLTLTMAFDNVFNAAYKTYASGVYAPGRNFIFGIRAQL
jgi:outer membrane receptor protein involved in Fe transport